MQYNIKSNNLNKLINIAKKNQKIKFDKNY